MSLIETASRCWQVNHRKSTKIFTSRIRHSVTCCSNLLRRISKYFLPTPAQMLGPFPTLPKPSNCHPGFRRSESWQIWSPTKKVKPRGRPWWHGLVYRFKIHSSQKWPETQNLLKPRGSEKAFQKAIQTSRVYVSLPRFIEGSSFFEEWKLVIMSTAFAQMTLASFRIFEGIFRPLLHTLINPNW